MMQNMLYRPHLVWEKGKKKKYVFIRYLDSITQAFISAYFGLDSREFKCLEYLLLLLLLLLLSVYLVSITQVLKDFSFGLDNW
jgi:hypothetical protein